MRKTAVMVAVLMLAGCDGGAPAQPARGESPSGASVSQPSAPQWMIQITSKEALSDISAWLIERGYPPRVVKVEGKDTLLVGPFESEAEARDKSDEMNGKMIKAHRLAEAVVITYKP